MRIVIDLQGAQTESRYRGIGRYSMALALAVARNRGKHDIWLALNGSFPDTVVNIRRAFRDLVPANQIRVFNPPVPVAENHPGIEWRTRAAELIREYFLAQLQPDAVLVTSLFEGYLDDAVTSVDSFVQGMNTAVVHYDLIPLLNQPECLNTKSSRDFYYRKMESLGKAGLLLAISESTRKEALVIPELANKQIVNISAAVENRFRPLSISEQQIKGVLDRYGIKRKTVMYVPGGFDSRKNFGRLFEACSGLPEQLRKEFQLVIVGKPGDEIRRNFYQLWKNAGLKKDGLVLTGYVPDDDLVILYNSAVLYVCPSTHEGFGLPVLEAMACGAPVIGSDASSIPEVIGKKEALFDPESPESIAECMAEFLQNDSARDCLRQHGLRQVKKFSWDKSAKTAIKALEGFHSKQQAENRTALQAAQSRPGAHLQAADPPDNCLPDRKTLLTAISEIEGLPPGNEALRQLSRSIAASILPENPEKQLLVDISSIFTEDIKTGIQRVVRAQLLELLKNPPYGFKVEPVYLSNEYRELHYRYARSYFCSLLGINRANLPDEPADMGFGDILYKLDYCPQLPLKAAQEGLYQQLKAEGVFISAVIYDLLPILRPEFFPDRYDETHSKWLEAVTEFSDQVICISGSVAAELEDWLGRENPGKKEELIINSIHLGAEIEASVPSGGLPEETPELLEAIASAPSFIMVGTIEPRKGYLQAIRAFDLLWAENEKVNLVIVGREGWTRVPDSQRRTIPEIIKTIRTHEKLNKRLFWLEGISDEFLLKAYEASTCLLFASEGEGFGLPLIEAARHGVPIFARDIPVFREIAEDHAHYFSGLEPAGLTKELRNWLELYRREEHPSSQGIRWLTWAENVEQLKGLLMIRDIPNLQIGIPNNGAAGANLKSPEGTAYNSPG